MQVFYVATGFTEYKPQDIATVHAYVSMLMCVQEREGTCKNLCLFSLQNKMSRDLNFTDKERGVIQS